MDYLQAAVYYNHFDNMRWRHDEYPVSYPVSYYVEKDGETKFWDGGQCEILEEGTYNGEAEEGGQGWNLGFWNNNNNTNNNNGPLQPGYEESADDHDLQIALALSEEDARMDEELAKSRSDLHQDHLPEISNGAPTNFAPEQNLQRDEELAKRFSDLNPVPHVPRVNAEIPFVGASEDKQRLSDRLRYFGLAERQMAGDGNCQFRALSDQLYRTPDHHMVVRTHVITQLTKYPNSYSSYVPMDYNKYLENMARDGEWGDHVTLQAAADFYGMKISLITSFKETCFIEIIPAQLKLEGGLYLSFWSEIHYNSIYLLEESVNGTKDEEWVSLDD